MISVKSFDLKDGEVEWNLKPIEESEIKEVRFFNEFNP